MAANDDDYVGNIQINILINVTLRGTGMVPVLRKHASISSSEFWEMSQSLLEMNSTGWPRIRDKDDLAVLEWEVGKTYLH